MVQREDIRDIDLSLRFKHGTHTIFLFVDPQEPFSTAAAELLEILRSRYPDGLTTSTTPPPGKQTPLPQDASRIEFAVAKSPADPSQGWKPLGVSGGSSDTPVSRGVKDGMVLAFAIRPEGVDEDEALEFEVEYPSYEDEEYAEEEEQ
ncbi:uncharacterized protein B0I36DRAFT_316663 [Microdochium trichocladiopsis]|uniref:Uncharacterized protein n=1 Tax=Microdochium trichocladiopsis TaxID=1682393 RepID=A0A9P8YAY9_9PEZI|nr:uncharacterized protein B0I36DRAFT_316663 [Microdochium trichocladiopsis]KAH7034630.1 hypothetical protein B0I36DRAFT_316663 [Microdochium trichocladiopsis]